MVARVARRYLLGLLLRPKARSKTALDTNVPLPTLWLENEHGDRHIPDFENPYDVPPKGFVYQHSRFPRQLTTNVLRLVTEEDVAECPHDEILIDHGLIESHEGRICRSCGGTQTKLKGEPWPTVWNAYGSHPAFSSSSSFPEELVLAMTRPTEQERAVAAQRGHEIVPVEFDRAVILAAESCERCLNVLLWRHGCDDGYEEGSPDWHKANTVCFLCKTPENTAMKYSYDRTAAKPKAQDKEPNSRTDGVKKSEVTKAEAAIRAAIDAVLDCAPNSRDFHSADEDEYDSKAYNKAVAEHNKRVDALHDILDGILKLMPEAK